ncbi:hypothetical protein EXIGLDRAFT_657539 [Exidia glandulosa HHB12029]|uniref:Oxysterol-binding protein n=1 Tax=Exidia glandulosa HHB12029 TaxID=1314781 RepID=A0A165C9U4_EXIGL|nr:hypothetical protein EXIGLDRAFT_657539 [Exidia glandulosa HHB12029]
MIVDLLKRSLGVKDLAAMCLSLPAQLLEPIPNLEYWMVLDRPDLFAAINDSPEPLGRMLAVLRWAFSKELKFIRGKICKPYNSVLGEHFRCHYDVRPVEYDDNDPTNAPTQHLHLFVEEPEPAPEPAPTKSRFGGWSPFGAGAATPKEGPAKDKVNASLQIESNLAAGVSNLSLNTLQHLANPPAGKEIEEDVAPGETIRVVYLTEQVSHHPPISAFYAACPARGLEAEGIDQISARVSGTTVRIMPGTANKGVFIRITSGNGAGESYRVTLPTAQVNGILRGSFYPTISDSVIVTCSGGAQPGTKLRAVIEYKEESWLGKPQFLVEGVIHTYEDDDFTSFASTSISDDSASVKSGQSKGSKIRKPDIDKEVKEHSDWTKVKHVPKERIVAQFEGTWKKSLRWRKMENGAPVGEWRTLLDLSTLAVFPKEVRPVQEQAPFESRRLWEKVTDNLLRKEFGEATRAKVNIEQAQRDRAAERKRKGEEFVPAYFESDLERGWSELTEAGRQAVQEELARQ